MSRSKTSVEIAVIGHTLFLRLARLSLQCYEDLTVNSYRTILIIK